MSDNPVIDIVPEEGRSVVANEQFGPENLIAMAIKNKTDVDTMERLLVMYEKIRAAKALTEFNQALADFQAECPEIEKQKTVLNKNGTVRYKYAPLESIVRQVKDVLKKHGFSYTIKTEQTTDTFTAICEARHIGGHFEQTSFKIPLDKDAYMTTQQIVGSASTFSRRYAFCNAFGIMTGDEDNDANINEPDNKRVATDELVKSEIIDLLDSKIAGRYIYAEDERKERKEKLKKRRYSYNKLIEIRDKVLSYVTAQQVDIYGDLEIDQTEA